MNKEGKKARDKAYYEKNKKQILVKVAAYRNKNRKIIRKKAREYYYKHIEKRKAYLKIWRAKNKRYSNQYGLFYKYGLTKADYDKMFEQQNGRCKICNKKEFVKVKSSGKIRRLSVDHCHKTGKIRGLLCSFCNSILGKANDDIKILESAINYLNESRQI